MKCRYCTSISCGSVSDSWFSGESVAVRGSDDPEVTFFLEDPSLDFFWPWDHTYIIRKLAVNWAHANYSVCFDSYDKTLFLCTQHQLNSNVKLKTQTQFGRIFFFFKSKQLKSIGSNFSPHWLSLRGQKTTFK